MLELKNVSKIYNGKAEDVTALDSVDLKFDNTGLVFILGESGSGKTTLLNILGGIDKETNGEVFIDGTLLKDISYEKYRRDIISFVFQDYNLLPKLNVYENISLLTTTKDEEEKEKITKDILHKVGLDRFEKRDIEELSGGQRQRVAIARALAKNCQILLCDEPTGNLDSKTSAEIFNILKDISKEKLVIVVSHNEELSKKYGDRFIYIKDGKIEKDETVSEERRDIEFKTLNNQISFKTIIRYGLNNLSRFKFKTIVSCVLLILSMVSLCAMVISLTYNSEHINAGLSNGDKIEYVVKNAGTADGPFNSNGGEISNIESIIPNEHRIDGYKFLNSIFYIVNDNEEILDNYDYYFRGPLDNESCYITDYYLEVVLKFDSSFELSDYEEIEDLTDAKVYYKGIFQYKIAGVIKTDYIDFFTPEGRIIDKHYKTKHANSIEAHCKERCEYDILFGKKAVCERATFARSGLVIKENVEINYGTKTCYPYEVNILYNEANSEYEFLKNDGYYGSLEYEDRYTKKVIMKDDEVVISSCLYNYIYNESIDWADFDASYHNNITWGTPLVDSIEHLNETISVINHGEDNNISIHNVKIIGVVYDKDKNIIYSNFGALNSSTVNLNERYISIVNWEKIGNKTWTLDALRRKDLLLSGAKFEVAYSYEYIVKLMSYTFITFAAIFMLFAIFSIINLVIHRINDNKREIGILYATGCSKLEIIWMYLASIIFLAVLALIISVVVLTMACTILNFVFLSVDFGYIWLFYPNIPSILSLIAGLFMIVLISGIPLYKYLKKSPIEIIRKSN